jgi:D-alanine-D-alanine ligase
MNNDRVAVLMGGWTSEASVSRVSASFCGQAARNAGWDAVEVEVDRDLPAKLREISPWTSVQRAAWPDWRGW